MQDLNYENFEIYEDENEFVEDFNNKDNYDSSKDEDSNDGERKAKSKITIPRFQTQNDKTAEFHVRLANINLGLPKDILDDKLKAFMEKFLYLDLQNEINTRMAVHLGLRPCSRSPGPRRRARH